MKNQTINTACKIIYPDKTVLEFETIEDASKGTEQYALAHPELAKRFRPILSVASIKLRCNKSTPAKDGIICEWLDEHTKRSYRAKKSKSKGKDLEYQVRDSLRSLSYLGCERSAGESKKLDNNKIDIVDTEGRLPINIQVKNYANTPNYFGIREECTDKSKPFTLIWKRNTIPTDNTVAIIPVDFFYKLLDAYTKINKI